MKLPYDTLLFDLDGTIIDSAPGVFASLRPAFAAVGLPEPSEALLRRLSARLWLNPSRPIAIWMGKKFRKPSAYSALIMKWTASCSAPLIRAWRGFSRV